MLLTTDLPVVWSFLIVLAHFVTKGQGEGIKSTLYRKMQDTQVDKSQEFSLGERAAGRTSCVVACTAHDQCQSVNFRSGGKVCMGTSKAYFSFGSNVSAESGSDNFSPQAIDVRDGDWILVFRAQRGVDTTVRDRLLWSAWTNDSLRSDEDLSGLAPECFSSRATSCLGFFRSRRMANWPGDDLLQVRLALYKDGQQKAQMIFNGSGSTRDGWFNSSRLISSTWTDLTPGDTNNFLSLHGQLNKHRLFVATQTPDENECNQVGWLIVEGQYGNRCRFDKDTTVVDGKPSSPQFLYSTGTTKINFNNDPYGQADVMAIFIKLK